MTPEEREVIEAARHFERVCGNSAGWPESVRIVQAVRALDQPYRVREFELAVFIEQRLPSGCWVSLARTVQNGALESLDSAKRIVAALNEKAAREDGKP